MPNKRISLFLTVLILLVVALSFYPLDSYISKPGGAYELSPIVAVENGDTDDEGSLSLMTIALMKATPVTYAWATIASDQKIMEKEQVRRPNENEREYNFRQLQLMSSSQFNALYVAFNKTNNQYEVTYDGVYIVNVMTDGAAAGKLHAADKILSIDRNTFERQQQFIDYLANKKVGDVVEVEVEYEGQTRVETIELKEIPNTNRAGLGIAFTEDKKIETTPSVIINTEDIGGPSAGLMFTLEIMNQLLEEDLTKGYTIAGTGEMLTDGTVGRIGGIDFKIIAAHRAGIEIFFAPDDEISPDVIKRNPSILSNYDEAVKTAEKIGTDMKVVPVKTIDDALQYLKDLTPKDELTEEGAA